jgi:hypothetical protein
MKKLLISLGVIFLILLVSLGYVVINAEQLDRASKEYADQAVITIASDWNTQALLERASPEFMKAATGAQINSLFGQLRRIGRMTKYEGSKGQAYSYYNLSARTLTTTAVYVAQAQFEHGTAQMKITMIERNGSWEILGFSVQGSGEPGRIAA